MSSLENKHAQVPLRRILPVVVFSRTIINMSHRIVYPFLPALALSLGISLQAAGLLVSLRGLAGLLAPLAGPLANAFGRRRVMEAGLLLVALGAGLMLFARGFPLAALAIIIIGISKSLYDPAMQAYLGDRVPYTERGRALGLTELSWSGSWLIGVPITGLLLDRFGWGAAWFLLVALALVGWLLTAVVLPRATLRRGPLTGLSPVATFRGWGRLLRQRQVWSVILVGFGLMTANDIVTIVYGAWLSDRFGLSLSALGLASIVVGLAEAGGEFGAATIVDRVGKRRSVMIGLLGLLASYLLLPFLGRELALTLAGFMAMVVSFEFALVSLIPLVSEVDPTHRADVLSLNVASLSLAHMLGAALGAWLWRYNSIAVNVSAALLFLALALLTLVRTPEA